ncbi:MAG: hypothetical protein AAF851_01050 [Myxococcota bacterium]
MRRFILAFASLGLSTSAFAQTTSVQIQLNPGAQQVANQLNVSSEELQNLIDEQIRALYGLTDIQQFLTLSANAQNMINKGIGVDYASLPKGFLFGLAVSGAFDAGDSDIDDLQSISFADFERAVPVGVGAQASLMLGYNFTEQGAPWLTLYLSGLGFQLGIDEYDGDFYNVGFHSQFKLLKPLGRKTLLWGGLDFTTGIEFSEMILRAERAIETNTALGEGVSLLTSSSPDETELRLRQTALTFPFEVTTSARIAYFLGLYGGIGVDVQLGGAELSGNVNSTLFADGGGFDEEEIGTVSISANDQSEPTQALFRIITGVQIHLGPIKAFGQLNFLTEDLTVGGTVGLRYVPEAKPS